MKLKSFEMYTKEQLQQKLTASELNCIEGGRIGERYRRKRGEWEEPTGSKNTTALSVLDKLDKINDAAKGMVQETERAFNNFDRKAGISPARVADAHAWHRWFLDWPGAELQIIKYAEDSFNMWMDTP